MNEKEKDCREKLFKYRHEPAEVQQENSSEIIQAIKDFWDSNPTEVEFGLYMSGIVLFPETIHYMIKGDKK